MKRSNDKNTKITSLYKDEGANASFSLYDKESRVRDERLIDWITFYRRNIEYFAQHYLKIQLFPFQKIILHLMGTNYKFCWVSARANAKSFTTALYCVCRCILYPNTKMVIVSKKTGQAALIITEKIQRELMVMSPVLKKEISKILDREGKQICLFNNGSYIKVVVLADTARGERSNCVILEEARLLDKKKIDEVIIPFNTSRTPPYTKLPQYKNAPQEQSQQIFISSATWKNTWFWTSIKEFATEMCMGKKYCIVANDMYLSLDSRIKTKEDIFGEKKTMDSFTFATEYENQMIGEAQNSYFVLNDFDNVRKIKTPFYPLRKRELVNYNHARNPRCPARENNEIRVVAVDIAMKAGKDNDNTIIHLISAKLRDYGYQRDFMYTESYNGKGTSYQALRIKQLFAEFRADYVVLDTLNAGISVFDELSKNTIDPETGEHYSPMTVMNENSIQVVNNEVLEDMRNRTVGADTAIPVIFPMQANSAINSAIAVDFKKQLEDKKINLCLDEQEMMDILMQTKKDFREGTREERMYYMSSFMEHSELIKECVNLEMNIVNGFIRLQEPRDGRKDRYSSASYGNYFISLKERSCTKKTNASGASAFFEAFENIEQTKKNNKMFNKKTGFKFL